MESVPTVTKGMVQLTDKDNEILQPVLNGAEEVSGVGDDQKEKLGVRAIKVKIQNFEFNGSLDIESGILICSNYSQMHDNGEVKDSIAGQIANLAFQFDNFKATVSKELNKQDIEIDCLKKKISGPNLATQFDNFKAAVRKELKERDFEIEYLKTKISGPRPNDTRVIRCWQCQHFGHIREDCPQNMFPKKEDKSAVKREKKQYGREISGC